MTARGKLFVFEGPDGCGKTTLANKLASRLGGNAFYTPFPNRGSGTIGEIVYQIHHKTLPLLSEPISPTTIQALHVATHLESISTFLEPRLKAGVSIVLDRFWWSTWAYAKAFGADLQVIEALLEAEKILWGKTVPTHMFVIRRDVPYRAEYPDHWDRLNSAYDEITKKEHSQHAISVIKNDQLLEDVLNAIEAECRKHLSNEREANVQNP